MGTATVLVVEDEPVVLDFVDRALSSHGYEVRRASGPRQALEIMKEGSVDLVLSDVSLPEMSGVALVQDIARVSPVTATLLMSGWTSSPQIPAGVEVLGKPFSPKTLLERVEQVLASATRARAALSKEMQRVQSLHAQTGLLMKDLSQTVAEAATALKDSRLKRKKRAAGQR